MKDQLDVTCCFISLLMCSTCCASACKTNTSQQQSHQSSNTQRTENKTTDVVIHQHSRKLLKMDILMSETRWAHKNWNWNKFWFCNKFIISLYMFRALCADHQEVKIILYSFWYHHTCRWPSHAQVLSQPVHGTVWWYQILYNTILTYWWWAHSARNM